MVSLAGRIVKKREQGKLLFYGLKADGANVQIMASLSDYEGGEEAFWKVGGSVRSDLQSVSMLPRRHLSSDAATLAASILRICFQCCLFLRPGVCAKEGTGYLCVLVGGLREAEEGGGVALI